MSWIFGFLSPNQPPPQPAPLSKTAPKNAAVLKGEELIKRAVSAEQHNPAEALRLYTEALAVWVETMRTETNDDRKVDLSNFINHYMGRAEIMKTIVDENKKTQSEFRNYAHPTVSSTKKSARAVGSQPRRAVQPRITGTGQQRTTRQQQTVSNPPSTSNTNEYETQIMSEMMDSSPGVR